MSIASFNYLKRDLLERLTPTQAELATFRIDYTLKLLKQETLSAETLAGIIASCIHPTLKDTH